jgi:hypothetical protein
MKNVIIFLIIYFGIIISLIVSTKFGFDICKNPYIYGCHTLFEYGSYLIGFFFPVPIVILLKQNHKIKNQDFIALKFILICSLLYSILYYLLLFFFFLISIGNPIMLLWAFTLSGSTSSHVIDIFLQTFVASAVFVYFLNRYSNGTKIKLLKTSTIISLVISLAVMALSKINGNTFVGVRYLFTNGEDMLVLFIWQVVSCFYIFYELNKNQHKSREGKKFEMTTEEFLAKGKLEISEKK